MKVLLTVLALAVLIVVLLLQLGPGEAGGEGLGVEGPAPEERATGAEELASGGAPALPVASREDAAERPEEAIDPPPAPPPVEPDARFFGRVVAAEDGRPIPLAEVRVEESPMVRSAGRRAREFELTGEPLSTADPDGRFELRMSEGRRRILIVSADRRAPVRVRLTGGHTATDRALEIRLALAARLSGIVIDSRGVDEPLSVELEASTYWMMQSPGLQRIGGDDRWTAEVDDGGRFSFECLPPQTPLRIQVVAKRESVLRMPTPLTLGAGEHREVEWRLGPGTIVHGTVLDEDDSPVPGVLLWVVPASEAFGTYLPEHLEPIQSQTSDAQGIFCFSDLAPGDWTLGPAPEQTRVGAGVRVKTAPDEPPIEIIVRVARGGFISGRVLDPDGDGATDTYITAYGLDGGGWSSGESEEGGSFRLGPLLPGEYRLLAGLTDRNFAASEEVVARTDDSEVVLRLTRGGSLAGRVVDAHTREPVTARISIHGVAREGYKMLFSRENGDFDFGGLNPGTYHLVGKTEDGRVGALRHVHVGAGSQAEGLEILVDRGGRVRVLYRGPRDYATVYVESNGVLFEHDNLRNGIERVVDLPLGEALVRLKVHDRDSTEIPPPLLFEREARVEIDPDEVREVVFEIE